MNYSIHPDDVEGPHGNIYEEAHQEMIQVFGSEKPEQEWILTDFDVWAKNPYYTGAPGPHPEDDHGHEAADYYDQGREMEEPISDDNWACGTLDVET
jgi:hypothetical protein